MKRILAVLFVTAVVLMAQNVDFRVLAMVGDHVITNFDVERTIETEIRALPTNLSKGEYQRRLEEIRRSAVDSMINYELAYMEFEDLKAKIPQEAVQKRINAMVDERAGGNQDVFNDMLFQENMTRADFEKRIYKDIAVEAFVYDRVRRNIHISDEAVEEYFNANYEASETPAEYRIAFIAIKKKGRYAEEGAEKVAVDLLDKLHAGEDFSELAKQYSEGAKASDGGDMGWQTELAPAIREVVEYMKPGDVSDIPIEIGSSFYLVKLVDFKPGAKTTLTPEIEGRIRNILGKKAEKEKYDQVFGELANKYSVIRMD